MHVFTISRCLTTICILSTLVSCSYYQGTGTFFQNRDTAYLRATSVPPLKIPPGYTTNSFETYYPVSTKNYPENLKKIDPIPPELNNS